MNQTRRSKKNLLEPLLARYFRVSLESLLYFAAIWLIMNSSEPNIRSLIVGFTIVFLGIVVRVLSSGYGADSHDIVGVYRWVRYPKELGTAMVLVGLALCGKQIDVILLILLGCGLYFAYEISKKDAFFTLKAEPEAFWYQRLVSPMMPSFLPISKKMALKISSNTVTQTSRFSLRSAFFKKNPGEIRLLDYIVGHIALLLGLCMVYRFSDTFAFNSFFAIAFGGYGIGRFLYFALRGDGRSQRKTMVRD